MKYTTFCQIFTVGALTLGGLSPSLHADGPSDLEALAERAREAAGDTQEAVEEAVPEKPAVKEEVVEEVPSEEAAPKEKKAEEEAPIQKMAEMGKAGEEVKPAGEAESGEAVEETAEGVVEEVPKVEVDPAERAEKLGLLANLSKDVSAVTTFNNGKRMWEEVNESKIGNIVFDLLEENEIDLADPEGPGAQIAALFQEEFLIAVGKGTPKQLGNLLELNGLSEQYQTSLMVRVLTTGIEQEDIPLAAAPFSSIVEAISENPDFLVNLVSASEMPPILLAARVSDEGQRDEFAAGLEMGVGMALQFGAEEMPFIKSTQAEIAGVPFSGLEIDGELLVKTLEEEMNLSETLESFLDPASAKDLAKVLSEKSLVLLSGVSDEAIYLYLGTDAGSIPLVDDVAEGLASSSESRICKSLLGRNLGESLLDAERTGSKWEPPDKASWGIISLASAWA